MKCCSKKRKRIYPHVQADAIVLAVLVFTGGIVYAAGKYFGILDFIANTRESLPEEASGLIITEVEPTATDETEHTIMDYTVKEALCYNETIRIVYEVSAKESGKYLFIPEDAFPEDTMSNRSSITDATAEEYAAEHQLTLVNIGGGISNREELGIFVETMDFRSVPDDMIDIYVTCGKEASVQKFDVTCTATARLAEDGSLDGVMKKSLHFTLEELTDTVTVEAYDFNQKTVSSPALS